MKLLSWALFACHTCKNFDFNLEGGNNIFPSFKVPFFSNICRLFDTLGRNTRTCTLGILFWLLRFLVFWSHVLLICPWSNLFFVSVLLLCFYLQKLSNYLTGKFLKMYQGHVNKIYCITPTFSVTNGKYIVSGSEDQCIYLWDLQGRNLIQRIEGHTDTVVSVSCHPKRNMIASAGLDNDRTVRIWVQDAWFS